MIIKINNKGKSQWLHYADRKNKGGVILESGENEIDLAIWEKVKDSPWTKRLLYIGRIGRIEVGEIAKDKKDVKTKVKKTKNIKELNDLMDETDSISVKTEISKKIKDINDKED